MPPENKRFYAVVRWSPEDIMELRPDMSREQAVEWLEDNESTLINALTEWGWDAIRAIL